MDGKRCRMCGCTYPAGDSVCPTCEKNKGKQYFRQFWGLLIGAVASCWFGFAGIVLAVVSHAEDTPYVSILLILLSAVLLVAAGIALVAGMAKKRAGGKNRYERIALRQLSKEQKKLTRAQRMDEIRREVQQDRTPVSARILSRGIDPAERDKLWVRAAMGGMVGGAPGVAIGVASAKRKLRKMKNQVIFEVTYGSGRRNTEIVTEGSSQFDELMQLVNE